MFTSNPLAFTRSRSSIANSRRRYPHGDFNHPSSKLRHHLRSEREAVRLGVKMGACNSTVVTTAASHAGQLAVEHPYAAAALGVGGVVVAAPVLVTAPLLPALGFCNGGVAASKFDSLVTTLSRYSGMPSRFGHPEANSGWDGSVLCRRDSVGNRERYCRDIFCCLAKCWSRGSWHCYCQCCGSRRWRSPRNRRSWARPV